MNESWVFAVFTLFFLLCIVKNKVYVDLMINYFKWSKKITGLETEIKSREKFEKICILMNFLGLVVSVSMFLFFRNF